MTILIQGIFRSQTPSFIRSFLVNNAFSLIQSEQFRGGPINSEQPTTGIGQSPLFLIDLRNLDVELML
jgi:hypothetical protein